MSDSGSNPGSGGGSPQTLGELFYPKSTAAPARTDSGPPQNLAQALYGNGVDPAIARTQAKIGGDPAPPGSTMGSVRYTSTGPVVDGAPGAAKPPNATMGQVFYPDSSFDLSRVKLPEGVEVDQVAMGEFAETAKSLKLGQGAADKLLQLHHRAQTAAVNRQGEQWAAESREFYGDSLQETATDLRERISSMGDDGKTFMRLMGETKLGNHKAVLTVLQRLARGY